MNRPEAGRHPDLLLDAYLDGELSAAQRRQVAAHLAQCELCRATLEERRTLSAFLLNAPPASGLKPEHQFVSEVILQLPRRQTARQSAGARPQSQNWMALALYLVPLGLLLAWAYIQAVTILTDLIATIPGAGSFLAERLTLPQAGPELPQAAALVLDWVGGAPWIDWGWATGMFLALVISVLFVSWLAGWWVHHSQREPEQ